MARKGGVDRGIVQRKGRKGWWVRIYADGRQQWFKCDTKSQAKALDVLPTGAVVNSDISLPKPLVVKRLQATEQPRFVVLQKWEGVVLSVSSDSFIARLINQTDSGPDQEAEFSKEEIDQPDHQLIQPGAVFYWTLGYSDSPGGQRNRISSLRFRRLPAWNEKDLETAKAEAQKILRESRLAVVHTPPHLDEIEVSLFGPGYGESVLIHLGRGSWIVVDSCLNKERKPGVLEYLKTLVSIRQMQ